jgi:hemoglobin/transferrin/lactoferrin receptor protein
MGSHGPEEYLRPFYVQRQDSMDVVITNDDPRVQRPSAYSQINLMQKLRFHPNDKWDFQYGFHYSESSPYARYDRHIRYRNGLPRYGEWSYGPQKWLMHNLNVTHSSSNPLFDQVSLRLAWQFFEESRISRNFDRDQREIRLEKVNALSANLDFSRAAGARHHLYYGLEAVLDKVQSRGTDENIADGTAVPGPARYPQADWVSVAAYLVDHYRVSEKLNLQAGLRYNQFGLEAVFDTTFYPFPFTSAQVNKGALTGSIGGVYRPVERTVIRLNAATAFRSPNVDDLGKVFDSEAGSVVVPNPDLRAEYAWNADLGLAQVLGKRVKFDVTGYYTILDHALVRRDFTLNGQDSILYDGELSQVQAMQNAARARVYGVQAGVEIKFPAGFGFDSDINFQRGEEELDDGSVSPSRHAAPWFGVTRLTYNLQKLYLQVYATYSGARKFADLPEEEKGKPEIYAVDANGDPWSPGWYSLNFKAMYKFGEYFSVSAGIENLTDQRYRPYSSGIAAPGRNFILSLRAGF